MGIGISCPTGTSLFDECDEVIGVILDFDFLPPDIRAVWLQRLQMRQVEIPALIHGHNISNADAHSLRKVGARVCRSRVRKSALAGWLAGLSAMSASALC